MIELRNISKQYGRVRANDDISLKLGPGRIYALVGENGAGKSTLMRILAGHTRPDSGTLTVYDKEYSHFTPALAREIGVGMLYQDPLDFPAMPVWENFQLGGPKRTRREIIDKIGALSMPLGACMLPDEPVSALTVGERQLLELIRLLDLGATTLILDEPTTGITPEQKRGLFDLLKKLAREEHHTIILVTHKLSEAFEMADNILVMRQGGLVCELEPPYDKDVLLTHMFGEEADASGWMGAPAESQAASPRLNLEDVLFAGPKYSLGPLNLSAKPGECIGLAGLDGSGQEVFLRGLCGLDRMPEGEISLDDKKHRTNDFVKLHREGVHFVPAARLELAMFPELNLMEHITLAFPDKKNELGEFYQKQCVESFNLRAHPDTEAGALSGGNQQRLLLSLIPDDAPLLLMEHPTRGLDAGSTRQVWGELHKRVESGSTLFFFSPDLDEVLEHSHRIFVFYDRKLVAEVSREDATLDLLGALMAGQKAEGYEAGGYEGGSS